MAVLSKSITEVKTKIPPHILIVMPLVGGVGDVDGLYGYASHWVPRIRHTVAIWRAVEGSGGVESGKEVLAED